jgi:hypothetical protein
MALVDTVDGPATALRITLNQGTTGTFDQSGLGTMVWQTPPTSHFCSGCKIWESIDGQDTSEDREF